MSHGYEIADLTEIYDQLIINEMISNVYLIKIKQSNEDKHRVINSKSILLYFTKIQPSGYKHDG